MTIIFTYFTISVKISYGNRTNIVRYFYDKRPFRGRAPIARDASTAEAGKEACIRNEAATVVAVFERKEGLSSEKKSGEHGRLEWRKEHSSGDAPIQLVGILRGDVDGSWTAHA